MLKQLIGKAKFTYAFLTAVRDTSRVDAVVEAIDKSVTIDAAKLQQFFQKYPHITAFLQAPCPPPILDKATLRAYPEGSLGRAFVQFLDEQGIDPATILRPFGDSPKDRFQEHLRKTHDLWHTLTGFDTSVAGEAGLQAFYMAQQESPVTTMLLSLLFLNTFVMAKDDAGRRVGAVARGWLLGKRARPLFGVDWTPLLGLPIEEVRRQFNVDMTAVDDFMARAPGETGSGLGAAAST